MGEYVGKKMEEAEEARKRRSRDKMMKDNSMDDQTPVSRQEPACYPQAEKGKRDGAYETGHTKTGKMRQRKRRRWKWRRFEQFGEPWRGGSGKRGED